MIYILETNRFYTFQNEMKSKFYFFPQSTWRIKFYFTVSGTSGPQWLPTFQNFRYNITQTKHLYTCTNYHSLSPYWIPCVHGRACFHRVEEDKDHAVGQLSPSVDSWTVAPMVEVVVWAQQAQAVHTPGVEGWALLCPNLASFQNHLYPRLLVSKSHSHHILCTFLFVSLHSSWLSFL